MIKKLITRILSLLLLICVIFPTEGATPARAENFISEEMAQKFVDLFYEVGEKSTSTVDILTGKKEGTIDEIKEIYANAASVLGIINETELLNGVSEDVLRNTTRINSVVFGVIDIWENGKSFFESENNVQKTIDGMQVIIGALNVFGKSDFVPPQLKATLIAIEGGLEIGGFLEKAYLEKEGLQMYEVDLAIAYFSGNELPYVSPNIMIGSQITQEEAEKLYLAKYMEYKIKEIAPEGFYEDELDSSEIEDVGIAENIVDRNIELNKTTYIDNNLTINATLNLKDEILIVENDVIQNGGEINLNDGILIVQGDYEQKVGNLNVEAGYIEINGNYTSNANLLMNNSKGYMLVRGNMTVAANLGYGGDENITAGVLELKGDFSQYGDRNGIWYTEDASHELLGFCATGSHKTILSGTDEQTIYIQGRVHEDFNEYPNCSKFNVLESTNPKASLKGVSATKITNGSVFNDFGISYAILSNTEIEVTGNVNILSSLLLNNSKMNVDGNFVNSGSIKMTNPQDHIIIYGDYTQYYENENEFTDGIMEIKGNMVDCGGYQPTEKHKTVLSGDSAQDIDLHYYKSYGQVNYYGKFNSLEILNTSVEGVTISDTTANVYGELTGIHGTVITNPYNIYLCNTATIKTWYNNITLNSWIANESSEIFGNVNIIGETIFNSMQKINGDVDVSGTLINNDKLEIIGSLVNTGSINMYNPESYILLNGNYTHNLVNNSTFTDGIFEIKGNMIDCGGYISSENHKTILSGENHQTIDLHYFKDSWHNWGKKNCYGTFNVLQIVNISEEGVTFADDKVDVSGKISQPIGTMINNSSKVKLQNKQAFVDYGELNEEINKYMGNDVSVIPTWLDYENYIHKNYLTVIAISDKYINNGINCVSITAVSDPISDISSYDMLFITDGKEVRGVALDELFTTDITSGSSEIGILFKNIPYENASDFKARLGRSSEIGGNK